MKLKQLIETNEDIFADRKIQIAVKTLKMPDAMANIAGGPNKEQARQILKDAGWDDKKIAALEEDMIPEVGNKIKRPDLGQYGKQESKLAELLAGFDEDMTPEIGLKVKRPELGQYGKKKIDGKAESTIKLAGILNEGWDARKDPKVTAIVKKHIGDMGTALTKAGYGISASGFLDEVMDSIFPIFGEEFSADDSKKEEPKKEEPKPTLKELCKDEPEAKKEDMTPEVGQKTGRTDLGNYGKKESRLMNLLKEEVDKEKVKEAAIAVAKEAFGDKMDMDKVNAMVDKAIEKASDTQEAIGIVQSFFKKG